MRVGTVCYATDQGLGVLARSFYEAGVITDVLLYHHPSYTNHEEWYPLGTPVLRYRPFRGPEVEAFLDRVDVVFFFETPFDWSFAERCRSRGIRTVIMPMYEWFPKHPPHVFDKFICPSLLDVDYFPGSPFLVPPVDPSTWQLRTRARRFLHNSGHIGHRNHKGTAELLQAIPFLRPEVQLTIRSQQTTRFERMLQDYHVSHDHPGVTFEMGNLPRERLFTDYDVLVAPEKFNGLSLPLQEAYAAGMLVMGSCRYPMTTWLPNEPLIPVDGYHTACLSSHLSFDEAEISPEKIAATINDWYDRDITEYSRRGKQWALEHSWDQMREKFLRELAS